MTRNRQQPDRQLSFDLSLFTSSRSQESGSKKGRVVSFHSFVGKKQNLEKLSVLRKVLEHAKSLSW